MKKGLWEQVVVRDAYYIWDKSGTHLSYSAWIAKQKVICVVPLLDPDNPWVCNYVQEVDHVKKDLRMGKRAEDEPWRLVAMCQNHNTWHPPRKQLRAAERSYLATRYPEHWFEPCS